MNYRSRDGSRQNESNVQHAINTEAINERDEVERVNGPSEPDDGVRKEEEERASLSRLSSSIKPSSQGYR